MKTFIDNAGRTWTVAINVDAIKRVRALLEINLLEVVEGNLVEKLLRDPVLLCDVVYAVCKPEADARSVSDEEFGRSMAGDAIEHATKALLEDLVLFSPSPRDRANLQRVLQTTWRMMDKARDLIEARLDSGQMERELERLLETSSERSSNSPESSVSSPGR